MNDHSILAMGIIQNYACFRTWREETLVESLQGARPYFLSTISVGFVYKYMVIPWFKHYGLLTPFQKLLDFKLIFTMCLLSARHQAWAGIWEDCGCNSRIFLELTRLCGYIASAEITSAMERSGFRNLRDLELKSWLNCLPSRWPWESFYFPELQCLHLEPKGTKHASGQMQR